jgi:beta-lactamase class A
MQTNIRNYRNYSYQKGARLPVPVRRKHQKLKKAGLLFTAAAVILTGKSFISSPQPPQKAKTTTPAVLSATETVQAEEPAKKTVDMTALKPAVEQITKKYPYNTSVVVIDLNSGNSMQSGDSAPYVAASTTKLLTALFYLHRIEEGKEDLNQIIAGKTAEEQLKLMINRSDNTAWAQLNGYLRSANLQEFAHAQGLDSFNATKNTLTSDDMAKLLAKIYKKELLNADHTKLLFSWMQNTSEERFIPPAITANSKLYHKAGYLNDRAHDVAIVDNGTTPFALVIYSKSYNNTYDFNLGQKLFKQITSQVITTYNQKETES